MNGDIGAIREALARALGQFRLHLIGADLTFRPDEFGENRRVIAGSGADMHDALARLRQSCVKPEGVRSRFAIIEPPLRDQSDRGVLIDEAWFVRFRADIAVSGADEPGAFAAVPLALNRCERRFDALVAIGAELGDKRRIMGPLDPRVRHRIPLGEAN